MKTETEVRELLTLLERTLEDNSDEKSPGYISFLNTSCYQLRWVLGDDD